MTDGSPNLIAGGDGHMYLRWDHQLLRPSDGDVDEFRGLRQDTDQPA
jgi:hypothetical protein